MKKITGKLLAVLMISLFFFASCSNGSDSGSSGGGGGGGVDPEPYVPAEDPVIEDGTYFYGKNTTIEIKANSKGKSDGYIYLKEYVDYQAYLKEGTAEADDEIYEKAWRRAYTVEWLGSTPARKVVGIDGFTYYFYPYSSFVKIVREKGSSSSSYSSSSTLTKATDDVKARLALPDASATYISDDKYDDENYLYVVFSADLKTVTFYKDSSESATPSGDTNKIGDMQNQKWLFSSTVVRASNGDWDVTVRKSGTDKFIVVSNNKENPGSDSKTFSVKCVKKTANYN